MCASLGNEVDYFKTHLLDLVKNVQDESGSAVTFSPSLLQHLLPAFFVPSKLDPVDTNDNSIEFTTLRKAGWQSFFQSLSVFTFNQYSTLGSSFLERILLQAHSLLPMTKIASELGLDNKRYSTQYDGCDRLTIILGLLLTNFGTRAVDSFLYPLFTKHVFDSKHPQQTDQFQSISAFRNSIQVRGGSLTTDYHQIQSASSQSPSRWGCTIKYQLTQNSPFVIHQRNGQSKKQARVRTLQDILNHYTRNSQSLVAHCSSSSSASMSSHPHDQQLANHESAHLVETLSIPVEHLYQYDDTDHQQTTPATILSAKRPHGTILEDNSRDECNDKLDENGNHHISIVTQVLLYDFSNLSCNDANDPSAANLDTSSSITLKQQPFLNDSTLTTPTTISSPSSTITSSIKTDSMNEESMDDHMTGGNKKQRTQDEGLFVHQQTDGMLLDQQMPLAPPQLSPAELSSIATQMMKSLPLRSQQRIQNMASRLAKTPGDVKQVLKNLVQNQDGGRYECEIKRMGNSTINKQPFFCATVKIAMSDLTLVLTRQNPKKTDAETTAAFDIFSLLVTSSTSSTTTPIGTTDGLAGVNQQPPSLPLSTM